MKYHLSVLVICALLALASCGGRLEYISSNTAELNTLLRRYEEAEAISSKAFIFIKKIIPHLEAEEEQPYLVLFLTDHIQLFPDDPYNAYYLFRIAEHLRPQAPQEAVPYLRRIVHSNNYTIIDGVSIRRRSLEILSVIDPDLRMRIHYLEALLYQYPDPQGEAERYLRLAEVYSSLGKWEEAYSAYFAYQGEPNALEQGSATYRNIGQWINIYNSPRDWTRKQLDNLVQNIKVAIANKNISSLLRYRSKSNFFTMSWNQEEFDENSQLSSSFNMGAFLLRSRVQYASELEMASNNKEAYLRTWGWSYRIPVWYFYFRRVDFLADPKIHGNWEWAGIFFGDSL